MVLDRKRPQRAGRGARRLPRATAGPARSGVRGLSASTAAHSVRQFPRRHHPAATIPSDAERRESKRLLEAAVSHASQSRVGPGPRTWRLALPSQKIARNSIASSPEPDARGPQTRDRQCGPIGDRRVTGRSGVAAKSLHAIGLRLFVRPADHWESSARHDELPKADGTATAGHGQRPRHVAVTARAITASLEESRPDGRADSNARRSIGCSRPILPVRLRTRRRNFSR